MGEIVLLACSGGRLNWQQSLGCGTLLQRWVRFRYLQRGWEEIGPSERSSGLNEGEMMQVRVLAGTPDVLDVDKEEEEKKVTMGPS